MQDAVVNNDLMQLTRDTFTGPWAGLPVAWTKEDRFDEEAYRNDVTRCCRAGIPGVYTGGTTGEFYAMEMDEFCEVARATVEECHANGKPAMIGCSSTYTLGSIRRARIAVEFGADAIQLALPFWMEIGDDEIVPFFQSVTDETGGLPLSVYETMRSKRVLTIDQHRAIKDAVPSYLMVKANAGTIGADSEGCRALSEMVNVFVGENRWVDLGPEGVRGGCSSMVYWNPQLMLDYWLKVERREWAEAKLIADKIEELLVFLKSGPGARGLTDTAYDRLGGLAGGFLRTSKSSRAPYPSIREEDVVSFRKWCEENFPEMLYLKPV